MSEETIKKNESNQQKEKRDHQTIHQQQSNPIQSNPLNQLFFIVSKFPNIVSVNWIHLHPNGFPKKEREKERAKKKEKEKKKEKKERKRKRKKKEKRKNPPKFHQV